MPGGSEAPLSFTVTVGGNTWTTNKFDDVFEICADQDVDQPDMCSIALQNIKGEFSGKVKEQDPVKVVCEGKTLFDGEVTGLEPVFDHNLPSRLVVRALNKMHRLSRGRKSRTFEKMTDQDIITQVCQEAGLSLQFEGPSIKHDHVYQHNQSNLEFIRQRAARVDCILRVEGSTLFCKPRTPDGSAKLEWGGGQPGSIERFRPRLSIANQVKKVTCYGWDPIKKQKIVGEASASPEFGGKLGASYGGEETVQTERPIFVKEEADAIAKAILKERQMQFITGEALVLGNPDLKVRMKVDINVADDPKFSGPYWIVRARHRYIHAVGGVDGVAHREAGYRTLIRVRKDAEG
jgi:Bacteriophage probable baseplate hub protein